MERPCNFHPCRQKPAFICKCKSPPVYICDVHFSAHIKIKGLTHQYEFISLPSQSQENPIPRLKSPPKHEEIKKLISKLPEAARKNLLPQSPKSTLMQNLPNFTPKAEIEKICYSDSEYYEGEVDNGKEHGTGKFFGVFKEERYEYQGEWRYGLPHGKGDLTWDSGRLLGVWYQGGITGDGELFFKNGDVYTGEFFDCKFNGTGKYVFSNRTEVSGYFKDHFFVNDEFYSCVNLDLLQNIEKTKEKDLNLTKRFQLICEIFLNPLEIFKETATKIENCYFFKNCSLTVMKIDTNNLEKSESLVESSQKLPNFGGMCEVDSFIFHAGGLIGEKSTGLSFVMNPDTLEIRWIESCSKRSTPCAISTKSQVFLFGGSDIFLNFTKVSEVYSFESHSWTSLPSLPSASDGMSGGLLGKYCLLSGYMHTKVYSFDLHSFKYLECFDLPDFKDKVFCISRGTGFLMCNKKLYEGKCGNPFEWRVVRDIVFHSGWPVGMPVRRGGCYYWYTSDKEVWKFDKDTKGVFLLKKFK